MSLVAKFFKKPLDDQTLYPETTFWLGISRLAILILPSIKSFRLPRHTHHEPPSVL